MAKHPEPTWSAEQQAAAEEMRTRWEEFFGAAPTAEPAEQLTEPNAKILDVRNRHEADLMRYPNVVGVSEGVRMKAGKPTGERCIVVYVAKKLPRTALSKSERLPRKIEGIPVDVVEVGRIEPMKPGDSGSLLMSRPNLNAVGLLFAGSPVITIHSHISEVEVALGVRPVTATRFA